VRRSASQSHLPKTDLSSAMAQWAPWTRRRSMRLLHFRRTSVERLFAIHAKVALLAKRDRRPLDSYARHDCELYQLAGQPDVPAMLRSSK
jgi:hypothetical protein